MRRMKPVRTTPVSFPLTRCAARFAGGSSSGGAAPLRETRGPPTARTGDMSRAGGRGLVRARPVGGRERRPSANPTVRCGSASGVPDDARHRRPRVAGGMVSRQPLPRTRITPSRSRSTTLRPNSSASSEDNAPHQPGAL